MRLFDLWCLVMRRMRATQLYIIIGSNLLKGDFGVVFLVLEISCINRWMLYFTARKFINFF